MSSVMFQNSKYYMRPFLASKCITSKSMFGPIVPEVACDILGVSIGGQNKPRVASSRVKDNVSCRNSHFSSSSACRDSLFTGLGLFRFSYRPYI